MADLIAALRRKFYPTTPKVKQVVDPDTGEVISELNEHGQEVLDDVPLDPPLGYVQTPSLAMQIRDMVRSERLAQEAAAAGFDTFEEDDDFDVDDDNFDPETPYENNFDPPIAEIHREVVQEHEKKSKVARPAQPSVTEPAEPAPSAEPSSDA